MIDNSIDVLRTFIHKPFIEMSKDNQLVVEEKEKKGEAEVYCNFQNPSIQLKIEKIKFEILKNGKCADGIILEFLDNSKCTLHIIECKAKVSPSRWKDTKEQFEGALLRVRAIMGIIENTITIQKVKLYTAFREDKLSAITSASPVFMKSFVGKQYEQTSIDWERGKVKILGKNFKHEKIQLNLVSNKGQTVGVKTVNLS